MFKLTYISIAFDAVFERIIHFFGYNSLTVGLNVKSIAYTFIYVSLFFNVQMQNALLKMIRKTLHLC